MREDNALRDANLDVVKKQIAEARGWSLTDARFRLTQLAQGRVSQYRRDGSLPPDVTYNHPDFERCIDHGVCFRSRERPYRPVALLTYSYVDDHETHVALARFHGLTVEFFPESAYGYGTLAALYVRM